MNTLSRAVLLVAPVIDTLQAQLAAEFPLFRLYEQDDPIAFLREQGRTLPPWSRGVMSVCKTACWSCCRTWGGYLWRGDRCGGSGLCALPSDCRLDNVWRVNQ
jgi:hypothetical protein